MISRNRLSDLLKRMPLISATVVFYLGSSFEVMAAAKANVQTTQITGGKKVVAIAPIVNVQIEMPDQSMHNFGQDFQASLTNQMMQSGQYIVTDPLNTQNMQQMSQTPSNPTTPTYQWDGSVTPVATVRIHVDALNFSTGLGGDHMFYGFDERFRNPFNDGTGNRPNEFPLRLFDPNEPSWFRSSFQQKGVVPFDSRSGLDLGDGFQVDALMAWLTVKYASYHSELHLTMELDSSIGAPTQSRIVIVSGDGFFFDVAGGYELYSGGITVARTDAMNHALQSALAGSYAALNRVLSPLPMLAKVDAVMSNGTLLLGTGPDSAIPAGALYEVISNPQLVIQVSSSVPSGSIGTVVHGDLSLIQAGQVLQQANASSQSQMVIAVQTSGASTPVVDAIQLPTTTIPQVNLDGFVPTISQLQAFETSLVEGIFLPYRIWRYFMYDQTYHQDADLGGGLLNPSLGLNNQAWSAAVGLAQAPAMSDASIGGAVPVVAIIDSGIDYNHPALHDSLWLNSTPWQDQDGRKDRYGWDFISEDSRPYDDGYHGTEVASTVLGVAPKAKIMALKIFNPWGITTSAAIYGAFTYAVDHGAQIILCSWASVRPSDALSMGIAYAKEHGVVVVTSAGDDGLNLTIDAYYPAVLSATNDNVLTVTAVDAQDRLIQSGYTRANYGARFVQLAAPGANIPVADPRSTSSLVTSTDYAAAMVAGAMARYLNSNETYSKWMSQLLADADSVPSLEAAVQGGLRLHIRK